MFYSSLLIGDHMKEGNKTKKQLVHELMELHSQNAALEKSITGSISAQLAVEELQRYAESIVETIRQPLLVLDADLKIISANRNFYSTFKVIHGETLGCFIYDLGNKQWNIPGLRKLLEEVLPEKQAFYDFEVAHNFQDIGHKIMLLNAHEIYRKDIGAKMILLAIEDITERKQAETQLMGAKADLERSNKDLEQFAYPRGLKGEEILIEARILAVADVVETMASHRPYRPGLGIDAALGEIEKNRGLLYDSHAADTCLRLFREKGYRLAKA